MQMFKTNGNNKIYECVLYNIKCNNISKKYINTSIRLTKYIKKKYK